MSLFVWSSEYSIHHTHIDNQHKQLFRLADDLHAATTRGAGHALVRQTLARLIDYTRTHFREEEGMMLRAGYPQYAPHKAEHDSLTAQVTELQCGFEAGEITVTIDTMKFLRAWLEKHIMVSDQKLGSFFANRNALSMRRTAVAPTLGYFTSNRPQKC